MSFNLMPWLEEMWRKHEKIDPLAHKVINADIKRGSRLGEHFGHFIGSDWLANEAKQNQENPNRAAARGAVGTAAAFAGMYAYPYLAGAGTGTQAGAATSGAGALANSGMFAAETAPAVTENAVMQEMLAAAAKEKAAQGLASGGMFGAGDADQLAASEALKSAAKPAAQSFRAQIFGGPSMIGPGAVPAAPGMEGAFAKDAVNLAYKNGQMSLPDYMLDRGKVELMNLDQPEEWARRFNKNIDGMFARGGSASNYGQSMAMNALLPKQQSYQPVQMPRPQQQQMPQQDETQKIIADFKAGRISEVELRQKLQALGGMA